MFATDAISLPPDRRSAGRKDRHHAIVGLIAVTLINALDPSLTCGSNLHSSVEGASTPSHPERAEAMPDVPVIRITEISTTIHPPLDVDPADRFGVAVAIDGDRVFIGNDGRRDGPPAAGMVTVHERVEDEYRETVRLRSPRSRAGDEFGADLAIADDLLVVGAPGMNEERGGAWLFRLRNGRWKAVGPVTPSTPNAGDRFGEAVAIEGGLIVVGGPRADVKGVLDRGRVACFRVVDDRIQPPIELEPPIALTGLRFGTALAVGNLIVVGAPGFDVPNRPPKDGLVDRAGGAWRFSTDRPHRRQGTLLRPDPARLDRAGRSIVILPGDRIVVAAPRATLGAPRSGVITVHDRPRREYAAPIGPEAGLGTRMTSSPTMLAATIPGRRDATGRVDAAVRINRIGDRVLIPVLDLVGLGVGGSVQRIDFDPPGLRLAIGVMPPGDGLPATGVVHVVDFSPPGIHRRADHRHGGRPIHADVFEWASTPDRPSLGSEGVEQGRFRGRDPVVARGDGLADRLAKKPGLLEIALLQEDPDRIEEFGGRSRRIGHDRSPVIDFSPPLLKHHRSIDAFDSPRNSQAG